MEAIVSAIIATFIVSLISFVGALTLSLRKDLLDKVLKLMVSFASGAMLGAAFFDLMPEALHDLGRGMLTPILLGIVVFFLIERFLHWHHHHASHSRKGEWFAPVAYPNLFGDGVHNFLDGIVISASFITSFALGIATTIAVVLHEIPQEMGDFGILIYSGLKPRKALFYNFLSALTAIVGALVPFIIPGIQPLAPVLVAFAAGGFIYIAVADLMPELHKETDLSRSFSQVVLFIIGIALMSTLS